MPILTTALMLVASNVLMTLAWYWHVRKPWPLAIAILISWGIAFFEYCLAVPANRIGYAGGVTGQQLKVMQEVITLTVFGALSVFLFGEPVRWTYFAAMACLVGAVVFIFLPVE